MTTIPADTQLHCAAENYVHSVAQSRRFIEPLHQDIVATLQTLLRDSEAALRAELTRHSIEYYDSQDVLDIALQICNVNLQDI